MRAPRIFLLATTLTLSAGVVPAQNPPGPNPAGGERAGGGPVNFRSHQLANGLRLLLVPDPSESGVAVNITFDAGSRNERPGRTGLAKLLEHVVSQKLRALTGGAGAPSSGEANVLFEGTVNQERTSYSAVFPAGRLEAVLPALARLMRAPDFDQATLGKQRALVMEERRQAGEKPYGAMDETLLGLIYSNFSYGHGPAGSLSDLGNLTSGDVRAFFGTYYAPNNAVITIVGNFDEGKTRNLVETHFKSIPRRPAPPRANIYQARLTSERRKTIEDPRADAPFYYTAYLTVPSDHADWYALNLLADILGQGNTSRLHAALVARGLASSVPEGVNESRAPGLFRLGAKLPPGGNVEMVEAVIDAEIARLQRGGVTEAEMEKARSQERQYSSDQLRSAAGRANFLARAAVYYRDPGRINRELGRLLAVTREDVRRVARRYLIKTKRAVVIVRPAALKHGEGAPAVTRHEP